jgi:lipopolysaccharide assembly protein A
MTEPVTPHAAIQNAHTVSISFLGAHLHLSLAVALLLAAVAGALVMAAAGTARITELRQIMRRDRRKSGAGNRGAARLDAERETMVRSVEDLRNFFPNELR